MQLMLVCGASWAVACAPGKSRPVGFPQPSTHSLCSDSARNQIQSWKPPCGRLLCQEAAGVLVPVVGGLVDDHHGAGIDDEIDRRAVIVDYERVADRRGGNPPFQ